MNDFDVIIIGGGMVGLATACALSDLAIRIALVDDDTLPSYLPDSPTLRASAINGGSQQYFNQIGVWDTLIDSNRVSTFNSIDVKEKMGFTRFSASSENFQYANLGYIIENQLIKNELYKKTITANNISVFPYKAKNLSFCSDRAFVQLENETQLAAKLIVAADGAHSWVRNELKIPLIQYPYRHHALIATVETEFSHQACARQIFYPQGIVAFLPLWESNLSCMVWSATPDEISLLSNIDVDAFGDKLTEVSESWLGKCNLLSERQVFPLIARYCPNFIQNRLVLIGDAAHTIHPLAGQGVNLGLQDSVQLVSLIKQCLITGDDFGDKANLRRYQLTRQKDILTALAAMQTIQDIFAGSFPLKKIVRGIGMNLINHTPVLKKALIKYAMGL